MATKGTLVKNPQTDNLRTRVCWMYYVEELTQNQIAEILGISRISVQRQLAEAKTRNEITFSINTEMTDTVEIERELESTFNIDRAVVVPLSKKNNDPATAIGVATGRYLSDVITDNMSVGAGWGRTLHHSIRHIRGRALKNFQVISMLGGIIEARRFNPAEFAWQLAEHFQGEGFLIPAPAIVDSLTTRTALIENCGLNTIFDMARNVDLALLSVGSAEPSSTAYSVGYLSDSERQSLAQSGAVGDLLFHFYDMEGKIVDHEINQRIVSVEIEELLKIPVRILASGGSNKVNAMFGALSLVKPQVVITDEFTARSLLELRKNNGN